jgi:hypothetical protein
MPDLLAYIYKSSQPHKVYITATFASTLSLYWFGRQSVFFAGTLAPFFSIIGRFQGSEHIFH